jgi:hypothetical protein
MAFTKLEQDHISNIIGNLCKKRAPANLEAPWYEFEINERDVIVAEKRPFWDQNNVERKDLLAEFEIAKLRYIRSENKWILYWKRASGKWYPYELDSYSEKLEDLVKEIVKDRYGCFFG